MSGAAVRLSLLLLLALAPLGAGCATRAAVESKSASSLIVLLPEREKPSGEVRVITPQGERVLNQSWQSVEIPGGGSAPGQPELLPQGAVAGAFSQVRRAMPAVPVHYLLYFKLDSAELLPESRAVIPEIARVLRERQPAQLSVVGHTDTTGSVRYNYLLGQKRAAAVVELLGSQGALTGGVEITSRGKGEPMVPTADQSPEPRNRRAEVTVR